MPQSLVKLYVHIIFSTKNRQALIDEEIENALYSYLGGICNHLECFPLKIGGHKEHVHIPVIKFLEELKSHSSNWIKSQHARYGDFYWQGGYGAFSVSPKSIETVKQYIESQHEHHLTTTFQDEFRRILREQNTEFDERYLWD